jgi:hypothetical protein
VLTGELVGSVNSDIASGAEGGFVGAADDLREGRLADIAVNSHPPASPPRFRSVSSELWLWRLLLLLLRRRRLLSSSSSSSSSFFFLLRLLPSSSSSSSSSNFNLFNYY